jgi:hypothetical protein
MLYLQRSSCGRCCVIEGLLLRDEAGQQDAVKDVRRRRGPWNRILLMALRRKPTQLQEMCSQECSSLFSLGLSSMESWLDETWQTLLSAEMARRGYRGQFHVELSESFSFFLSLPGVVIPLI